MHYCQAVLINALLEMKAECGKPATTKHAGQWFCDWCYEHIVLPVDRSGSQQVDNPDFDNHINERLQEING